MLPAAPDEWTIQEAAHLLRRAGFGGSPKDIESFHALGRYRAVESLLAPTEPVDAFTLPAWANRDQAVADMKARFEQSQEVRRATRDLTPEEAEKTRREFNQKQQRTNRQHGIEAQGWWFRRMLKTNAPLREKMVLFWHDHFATSIQKVKQPVLMVMQNELFRRHATGSFKELTHAILMDPAMMPDSTLELKSMGEILSNSLLRLPSETRAAVVMRYCDGSSYTQMGLKCNERPATLQARVARAMPLLRRYLEAQDVER